MAFCDYLLTKFVDDRQRESGMSRTARVVVKSGTADLVRRMIDQRMGLNQDEIARETGFTRSNVLTMIKQGRTKMPLDKIESFSEACGCPPDLLFRTAILEYQPAVARLIGRLQKVPMFEGAEEIIDVFTTALTEVLEEAQETNKFACGSDSLGVRISASFNLDTQSKLKLKAFIKTAMVMVATGGQDCCR